LDLLEEEGYDVFHVRNGQAALDATFESKFDLYLLDINVPLIDGITLLKELRHAHDETATIFLTSYKDKEMLESSFKSGADDYLRKPFDNDELLLRIKALLRRTTKEVLHQVGALTHDTKLQRILYENRELELSKKEYELLLVLMQHANRSVPKEIIINELWSSSSGGSDGAVRVYINRLKQLLPQMKIENIRGIGYRLVC
jgi:DNA-binding response OmpR family regulator